MRHLVLKCPADFFTLGRNTVFSTNVVASYAPADHHRAPSDIMARSMEHVCPTSYSAGMCQRFSEGASEAISFVAKVTDPLKPLSISLVRFVNRGQRCIVLIVDGHMTPDHPIELPEATDDALVHPNPKRHLSHARIIRAADGYLITYDHPKILQLNLCWSESIAIHPVMS